ncbi:hypothetical protein ACROYT_G021532 [Oculina patagonica]
MKNIAESIPDPEKFSSWIRYRRVIVWTCRFIYNARLPNESRIKGPLSVSELTRAEVLAVKCSQRKSFPDDFEALLKNLPLPPKSRLLAFTPYLDEDGLIRVGGRLRKASLPEETRHPVILDPKSEVTRLVILHHHLESRCTSDAQVLNNLRCYWILQGVRAVRKVSHTCQTCRWRRHHGRPSHTVTWLLFTAIHTHWSRLLRANLREVWSENRETVQHGVQWHFNPPASPHFGGVWERLVKSAKQALKAVAGNQRVTDETLLTFIAEAESMMNSRPLTHKALETCSSDGQSFLGALPSPVSLTVRPKWLRGSRDVVEGDLVLVMTDNLPRGRWPFARVTRVVRGNDGRVRSAEVKTKAGVYVRPVTKLCLLEEVSDS